MGERVEHSQGVQVGDHNTQQNVFVFKVRRRVWLTAATVVVLVIGLASCEPVRRWVGGERLGVDVRDLAERSPCLQGGGWVVPDRSATPPDGVQARTNPAGYLRWLHQHKAVARQSSTTAVTLRGTGGDALVIDEVWIVVVRRRPPLTGLALPVPKECSRGGKVAELHVQVDLDALPVGERVPSAQWQRDPVRSEYENPPLDLPFTVTGADVTRLQVLATSVDCDCDWRMEIDWIDGSRRGLSPAPQDGGTFRVTGEPPADR